MEQKITGNRFVLAVKSLERSAGFYQNKLGFTTLWKGDGWHFLVRDNVKIMIGECPDEKPAFETGCHSYFAYLEVSNIDALYKEFREKEIDIPSDIENKPWGQREFSVRTVDGHRITFGEEISADMFKRFMKKTDRIGG